MLVPIRGILPAIRAAATGVAPTGRRRIRAIARRVALPDELPVLLEVMAVAPSEYHRSVGAARGARPTNIVRPASHSPPSGELFDLSAKVVSASNSDPTPGRCMNRRHSITSLTLSSLGNVTEVSRPFLDRGARCGDPWCAAHNIGADGRCKSPHRAARTVHRPVLQRS
jgi:hypothetical protein